MSTRRQFLARGITLLAGASGLPGAHAVESASAGGVALAFDARSRTLLKATADAAHRSSDGGRQWTALALPPAAKRARGITSIAVSAGSQAAIYLAGHGTGVWRSEDEARRWTHCTQGLPSSDVTALATHAERPDTVYAYLAGRGIYRSESGGRRWKLMDAGPRGGLTRLVHSNMPGSMQSGWLFAATARGVQRSMDCFCGWHDAGDIARAVRAVAYDPREPKTVYAATDGGLLVSNDGGQAWSATSGPEAIVDALLVTPDGRLYAASADGGVFRRGGAPGLWERADA